jgi:UDP-N-acetylmuramate: L-alanyl-gamma-D-glutamyl-meso-diaminopimelate ligase
MDLDHVISNIEVKGIRARILSDADSIVQVVAPEMKSGDVVAILSNGGFGGIYEKLPNRLKALSQPKRQEQVPFN